MMDSESVESGSPSKRSTMSKPGSNTHRAGLAGPANVDVHAGFSHDLLKPNELNHQAVPALGSRQFVRRYGDGPLELRRIALPPAELTLTSLASNPKVPRYEAIRPDLHCDIQCERRSLEDSHVLPVGRYHAIAFRQRCGAPHRVRLTHTEELP